MSQDLYDLLGVSRDADAETIKKAYRRMARRLHPDVNPDPETQEQFKEVSRAYEVLSDPEKRRMYDLGGDPFNGAGGGFAGAGRPCTSSGRSSVRSARSGRAPPAGDSGRSSPSPAVSAPATAGSGRVAR